MNIDIILKKNKFQNLLNEIELESKHITHN